MLQCAVGMSGKGSPGKRVRNDYEEEERSQPAKIPRTLVERDREKRLVVILENASLETVKVHWGLSTRVDDLLEGENLESSVTHHALLWGPIEASPLGEAGK